MPDYIIEHVALFKVRNFIQCYAALCDMFYNNNTSGMKWVKKCSKLVSKLWKIEPPNSTFYKTLFERILK